MAVLVGVCYTSRMKTINPIDMAEGLTLDEAMHLQALEGNPLDADQVALERMFDREAWPQERRIDYLRKRALERYGSPAAE